MWSKIISWAAKYGKKALQWAMNNKSRLINIGFSAMSLIKSIWG